MDSILIVLAFCFFMYAWIKHPEMLRIDRPTVLMYGGLVTVINFLKAVVLFAIIQNFWPDTFKKFTDIFDMIPANHLLAVWWEDSFYVLPYLLLAPHVMRLQGWRKALAISGSLTLFLITTFHFMLGHLYQGPMGMVAFIYPIISYSVGSRKGLGTIMMLHIIFDFSIYMGIWALLGLTGG